MAFGSDLKKLRGKISAQKVADLIGVGVDRLRKWEERDIDPSDTGDIAAVERYFGCKLVEIGKLQKFDFVENGNRGTSTNQDDTATNDDYRIKYIRSLEEQNRSLKDQISSLTGQLRHLMLIVAAKQETNQNALVDILVKLKIESAQKVEDRISKENVGNYQKQKSDIGIP